MASPAPEPMDPWGPALLTGRLVLADGTIFRGTGLGATGEAVGEVCFNTAITGYQEILTDPSYAGQIIAFTFPHIGNVGANDEDEEAAHPAVRGAVLRAGVTTPSNWRAANHLDVWLKKRGIVALAGIDTRALTARIRDQGFANAVIAHEPSGRFDEDALRRAAAGWNGLIGADLAKDVSTRERYSWSEGRWHWKEGFSGKPDARFHVVAMDFGAKRNILRSLTEIGARVTVVPADASAADILALAPDGVFLSNGPGDPAATGVYAVPTIKALVESGKPIFGICLGHQMLALALGCRTEKMHQGHHGANHPVKELSTGKVEIVSMNHGFTVAGDSLPKGVVQTHVSLFDGTNCGIALEGRPVFSVQHHPEASPGPQDSFYLFDRFAEMMERRA
ncbi:MAG: glutamine-hydrolyzing carbamoyl-phosphate synthase small subunit [Alphaproteobacteria bacterium]|nr:glutamine-hydrolyzing carbamoyl-phosphate synthase small subunit [Alphaproteobacteria bacterium]